MKTLKQRKKGKPIPGIRKQLPDNFVCIAPDEAKHVFALINGSAHKHEKEIARLHYQLCLHCQEEVGRLVSIKESLSKNKNAKELLHRVALYFDSEMSAATALVQDSVQSEHRGV